MQYDVAIIGGGPAGASAAHFLSGKGLNVVMIERLGDSQYERYHRICGAGINNVALKHLDIKEDEILNEVHTLRVVWPQGNSIDMKIKGSIIDRPAIFMRLRKESEAKGLKIIKGSLKHLLLMENGCNLYLSDGSVISSKYVIGADGAHSVVRKCVFGTVPEIMVKVEEFHSAAATEPGVLQFNVSQRYGNFYQWYFPYRDGRCTGSIYGFAEDEPDSTRGVRTIPMGWVDQIVKRNVLLIGDAAGLPNPMTAGGLRTAILSAEAAAKAILKDDPISYEKWWKHSRMSDRRFMDVHKFLSYSSDEQLSEFSKYMTHDGLWINGFVSFLHHPKLLGKYIGCLMSLRFGW